jgi:ribokinase
MITVLGSINMDLTATTERLPNPGETVAGYSFATAAGGKGANQALAARRAGAEVRMVGAVGNDNFATDALALLNEAHANLAHVKTTNQPTGTAHILVAADGENVIVVVPGANAEVSVDDALAAVAATPEGSMLVMQFEIPAASIEAALLAAKEQGVVTMINTAPVTPETSRLAKLADIVVANETEFELFAGEPDMIAETRFAALRRLHHKTGQTLIVTLGEDGVVAIRGGEIFTAPGLKVTPVDTVGAGDTFCGYLAAGLDQGLEFEKALARAAAAGSLACTKKGAQPAIPLAAEVDAAIA